MIYTGSGAFLTSADAHILVNSLALTIAGPARIAKDAGLKKVGVLVVDVPSTAAVYPKLGPAIFGAAGVGVEISLVPPATADMTPQVQTLISKGAGELVVIGPEAFCVSGLKAAKTLAFQGKIVMAPTCLTDAVARVPGGVAGVTVTTGAALDPGSKEVVLYNAVMSKYANGARTDGVATGGYATVLALIRALSSIAGEVTAASVGVSLATMGATALPLAEGVTFKCDRKQPVTPAVCSTNIFAATLDANGKPKDFRLLDVSSILAGLAH
jgi:branched-chain amino acid transport system substrate-binding protein